MQSYVLEQGVLTMKEMPEPKARRGEVVIRLKIAGLNRRDLSIPHRVGKKK